jgi:outer membrane protein assembly factor BamB
MKSIVIHLLINCSLVAAAWGAEPSTEGADYWPQWRGPDANGVAPNGDPPLNWSETRNVKWKTDVPGKGSSSPIVWGNQVFVTTAIPTEPEPEARAEQGRRSVPKAEQDFVVIALDRQDGRVEWQKTVRTEVPHEGTHPTSNWAANSAVTDGQRLYAYFGSRGLYCLGMDGELHWEKDFGDMQIIRSFGEGSSPVLHEDKILVLWDHEGPSFLFALDKMTGKEIWRVKRDEDTSWSTPLVVKIGGVTQVITNATNRIRSYNFDDGSLIWECSGMTRNVIPSPVVVDGIVLLMSGFRGNALLAIRLAEARGDITGTGSILWSFDRDTPYAPSPLLYENTLYFLKSNNAILTALEAKTGKQFYGPQRLEGLGRIYASPAGAAGRVYISDREGKTLVIRHGPTFEVLATNVLDDGFDASPAIVGDQIFLRGQENLYCIATGN